MVFAANRPKTLKFSLLLVGSLLLLLFVLGAVIYFNQSRSRDRILMEFAVSRYASLLTEAHLQGMPLEESTLPDGVTGFGVYREDGTPELRLGTAPETIPFSGQTGTRLELAGEVLELLRPIGRFGPPAPAEEPRGYGFDMPMGEWGGGHRMMGPQGMTGFRGMPGASGSMGRQRTPPESGGREFPESEVGGARVSYTAYDVSSLQSRSRQLLLFILLALAVTLLLFALLVVISRRLQSAEARVQETRRLAELGEAARTLTHEIRNPLGALKMQASLLKKTLPPDQSDSVVVLDEEIGRISYLVERVREFLKNPVGKPERVELNEFLRGLRIGDGVELREASSPVTVKADREKLRSVLENLIGNAVDANLEGGSQDPVTLSVEQREGKAVVSVCDRGAGVPGELGERIFDPFFTTKTQGSGVGLAISRRFVEAAGGSLTFASREGGGSCFTMTLPLGGDDR